MIRRPPRSTLFPSPTPFGSLLGVGGAEVGPELLLVGVDGRVDGRPPAAVVHHARRRDRQLGRDLRVDGLRQEPEIVSEEDRKSTRLNSSHANISYAVFCLKK